MVHINQCDIINQHVFFNISIISLDHFISFPHKNGWKKKTNFETTTWEPFLFNKSPIEVFWPLPWSTLKKQLSCILNQVGLWRCFTWRAHYHYITTGVIYGYLVWSLLLRCYSRLLNMFLGLQSCITSIRAGGFQNMISAMICNDHQ